MTTTAHPWGTRVAVCLVEPLQAGNVGSVARAMKNMGLSRLVLVNPPNLGSEECRKMAVSAYDIVENARVCDNLREALAPFTVCVSTTRRLGVRREMDFTPRTLARHLAENLGEGDAAIVFGRENKGLNQDEIELAPLVMTIPADPAYPSLNVAQAVLIAAYELHLAVAPEPVPRGRDVVDADQIERLFDQALPLLLECGFLAKKEPQHVTISLRKLLARAAPEQRDIKILRGICSDMEWYLNHIAKTGKRDGIRTLDGRGGT